jgi:hypothetical protein
VKTPKRAKVYQRDEQAVVRAEMTCVGDPLGSDAR